MGNSEAKPRASSNDSGSSPFKQFANSVRRDDPPNPEPLGSPASAGKKQGQAAEEYPPKPSGWLAAPAGEKQEQALMAAEPEYPRRPGEPDCFYYVEYGSCKFGMNCKFNHPPKPSGWPAPAGEKQEQELAAAEPEYPRRPGEPDCLHYVRFGSCKYGMNCKFNHPPKPSGWPAPAREVQEQQEAAAEPEYPQRPGEPDCLHYVRFGSCKYGMNCKLNHPLRKLLAEGSGSVAGGTNSGIGDEASSSEYKQYLAGKECKDNHHGGGKAEVEQVKLNFIGLPLRPGTRVCSYYMNCGVCKFGSNCKFHHPEPASEDENWDASRHAIQGSSQLNFSSGLDQEALKEQPVPFLAPSPSCRTSGIIPPQEVYPNPEQSGNQAMPDYGKFPSAPLENVDLRNIMFGDIMVSSSTASEANLAVNTTVGREQCSDDANDIGIIDKDVDKQSEETTLQYNKEPNSMKPNTNYEDAALNHLVEFGEKVSPINSTTSRKIHQVGCSISEIMEVVVDAGAGEGSDEHFIATQLFIRPEYREMFLTLKTPQGRLAWLKRMCQEMEK